MDPTAWCIRRNQGVREARRCPLHLTMSDFTGMLVVGRDGVGQGCRRDSDPYTPTGADLELVAAALPLSWDIPHRLRQILYPVLYATCGIGVHWFSRQK